MTMQEPELAAFSSLHQLAERTAVQFARYIAAGNYQRDKEEIPAGTISVEEVGPQGRKVVLMLFKRPDGRLEELAELVAQNIKDRFGYINEVDGNKLTVWPWL